MSAKKANGALGPVQLSLLSVALEERALPVKPMSRPERGLGMGQGSSPQERQQELPEVFVVNPSQEPARDNRSFNLSEIRLVRKQRLSMQDEFKKVGSASLDYEKIPGWVQAATAKEELLEGTLQQQFLPQHGRNQLISPQIFFMSRLFNVRGRATPRERLVEFTLGRVPAGEVIYTGPEMRQSDGLVFMSLLNIVRDVRVSKSSSFEPRLLCEALWGTYNGEARDRLRKAIFRLQHAVVRFPSFSIQLVLRFEFPARGRWSVMLDEDICQLFKESRLVWLSLALRRSLPEGVATWLYSYIESQTTLIPWPAEKLREMCGSAAKPREFAIGLSRALSNLAKAKVIAPGWSIQAGIVHWKKADQVEALSG